MNDPLRDKSYAFALRVVRLTDYLNETKREYALARKLLDSAVNIGLLIEEGKQGEDRTDMRQKYSVANKEAFRTNLLLRLLRDGGFLSAKQTDSILSDCEELQKMLIAAIKTLRKND